MQQQLELYPDLGFKEYSANFEYCPFCETKLVLEYHSRVRYIKTLDGLLSAKQITYSCPNYKCKYYFGAKKKIFQSQEFNQLSLPNCEYGLDVTLYIGYNMHIKHQSLDTVYQDLLFRKLPINRSTVYRQYQKYLIFMQALNEGTILELKDKLKKNGGYILSIDAVHAPDSPLLFVCREVLSGIVLKTVLVETESENLLIPSLEWVKENFGEPIAIVSDMGHGMSSSISAVFTKSKHQYCHFHFLKNLGKDLLGSNYEELRQLAKNEKKK
jgi:hypothetical protein